MRIVTAVEGRHECTFDVAVTQTEGMAELVCRDLEEIGAAITSDGPPFGIVKMSVTAVHGEVRVCQSAAGSVERITVAVLAYFESNIDVNLSTDFRAYKIIIHIDCRDTTAQKLNASCIFK